MEKKINLQQITFDLPDTIGLNKEFAFSYEEVYWMMKAAIKQALEIAAEKATTYREWSNSEGVDIGVDKESITNVINLVE